jgi:hypothetical protein
VGVRVDGTEGGVVDLVKGAAAVFAHVMKMVIIA